MKIVATIGVMIYIVASIQTAFSQSNMAWRVTTSTQDTTPINDGNEPSVGGQGSGAGSVNESRSQGCAAARPYCKASIDAVGNGWVGLLPGKNSEGVVRIKISLINATPAEEATAIVSGWSAPETYLSGEVANNGSYSLVVGMGAYFRLCTKANNFLNFSETAVAESYIGAVTGGFTVDVSGAVSPDPSAFGVEDYETSPQSQPDGRPYFALERQDTQRGTDEVIRLTGFIHTQLSATGGLTTTEKAKLLLTKSDHNAGAQISATPAGGSGIGLPPWSGGKPKGLGTPGPGPAGGGTGGSGEPVSGPFSAGSSWEIRSPKGEDGKKARRKKPPTIRPVSSEELIHRSEPTSGNSGEPSGGGTTGN